MSCLCDKAYTRRFLERIDRAHRLHCRPGTFRCPDVKCPRHRWMVVARCVKRRCVVAPMKPAPPLHVNQLFAPTLVLRARVVAIVIRPHPRFRFRIVAQVLRVLKGRYPKKRFAFDVHSPSRSNLAVDKVITIEAWREGNGYIVDRNKRY